MIRIDNVEPDQWTSLAEMLWAKLWDAEWARMGYIDGAMLVDTAYIHVAPSVISHWAGRPAAVVADQPFEGRTYTTNDNDG